ncbi:MAG TPA: hypothetical protein VFM68_00730, partial [Candidatus Saccharimonadales bacterium]|nr:hypothetical protein [Candidatus Saccharimonadales bacterium]
MSENLTLIKAPIGMSIHWHPNHPKRLLPAEQVVGITSPNASTVLDYGYTTRGNECEEELQFDDIASARVLEFFKNTRAKEKDEKVFYNCHVFASYVVGRIVDFRPRNKYYWPIQDPVAADDLAPAIPYGVLNSENQYVHSIVGYNRPDENLSIIGDRSPLMISKNHHTIAAYGGVALR